MSTHTAMVTLRGASLEAADSLWAFHSHTEAEEMATRDRVVQIQEALARVADGQPLRIECPETARLMERLIRIGWGVTVTSPVRGGVE